MQDYIIHDEWKIIEEGFDATLNRISESLFCIGNGRMGQRANFEENYSGDSLWGSYIAGIYFLERNRANHQKNDYPEYSAKIVNSPNWIGIQISVNEQELDLACAKVHSFRRELDMQKGLLIRQFKAELKNGNVVEIQSERFISIADTEIGAIRYSVRSLNFSGKITITPYLDGNVFNEDSGYNEKFWDGISKEIDGSEGYLELQTKKTKFRVGTGMFFQISKNGNLLSPGTTCRMKEKYVEAETEVQVQEGDTILIEKFTSTVTSLNYAVELLATKTKEALERAIEAGFDRLFEAHKSLWLQKWETSDIRIEGDKAAQQGIRFNIFQLNQTYSGEDRNLNISRRGFTGEKHGGAIYWDTEAFCVPFYLATATADTAKNLLIYRHKQLQNAIENAAKLGFNGGAALYPMASINGEDCNNEWKIVSQGIHRNGAIAYAIWNYINYTGDKGYFAPYGFEVLLAISRFWCQRISWSDEKEKFVILGVTGPNEYENNVNNNFHTNYIAVWTLKFTLETIDYLKKEHPYLFQELLIKWKFNELKETSRWNEIIEKMYFPKDPETGLLLQQEGFFDKELVPSSKIPEQDMPINRHWSRDRILRSAYLNQADTLLSLFWFENDFSEDILKQNFDFYEPLTVHESSLSPCIHSILAAKIGYLKKSYEMFLRTSRLDLDNYNNDTNEGLHITSMGGTWMAFVMGIVGMRVVDGQLIFNPFLPLNWKSYSFQINFRGAKLEARMIPGLFSIKSHSSIDSNLRIWGKKFYLKGFETLDIQKEK
jgi:maltose phosphorylase